VKRHRWIVRARTTSKLGISDRVSVKLCRAFVKILNDHKIKGWSVKRIPTERGRI
jgi:hypothetical protein